MSQARNRSLAVIVATAIALGAGAAPASAETVLGTAGAAPASCPVSCLVEARVTGFQTMVGGAKAPVTATQAGTITSWSINLGKPEATALDFFNRKFGPAQAQLSILKPRKKSGAKRTYRLVRQSPVVSLSPHFGTLAKFDLASPLKIGAGQRIALTIPTWAPAFSASQSDSTRWRASRAATRARGDCFNADGLANLEAGSPQLKVGSDRPYGCSYRGAMLLYSAAFVPKG